MSERFVCDKCGEELLPEAKFCGKCGSKVDRIPLGTVDEQTQANQGVGNTCVAKAVPKNFESVIAAIWVTIGLKVLSGIIGLFDVRVYYFLGRFGHIVDSAVSVAFVVWLAQKIAERKNWARVTYIAFSLLFCVLSIFGLAAAEDNNGFCLLIDLIALVITLYCIVQLLNERMASCFAKAADGVTRALVFWGVLIAYIVFIAVYMGNHQEKSGYLDDCVEAALRGSDEAYKALITFAFEHSEYYGSEGEKWDAAVQGVDAVLAQAASAGSHAPVKRDPPKKSSGKIDWRAIFKSVFVLFAVGRVFKDKLREIFRNMSKA